MCQSSLSLPVLQNPEPQLRRRAPRIHGFMPLRCGGRIRIVLRLPLSFPQNDMQRRRLLIRSAGGLVGWGELSVPFLSQMVWKHI